MKKYKDDAVVQEVGGKLIRKIDMSLEEEMADLNRRKEEKLERARMRIIADNEDELKDLQFTLNQAMAKEEKIMNE
jgi:glycerate-2-kinase